MASESLGSDGVQVGEVGSPHGTMGALRVLPTTDFPERLRALERIWLDKIEGDGWEVRQWTASGRMTILQLAAVTSRDQAAALRGARILVLRQSLPELPVDSFYWYQLLGMAVRDSDGRELGRVVHVHRQGGAHDFLEVSRPNQASFWIPIVRAMVNRIDLEQQTIWVSLPEGLEELH